jgi:predicted HTH transcriptional regulator
MDKTLAKLKNRGVLRRVGPARGGHWAILEDPNE